MEEDELCFPQLNSSCVKLKRSLSETLFVSFLLCFISFSTVFLNLLVIISISHFRQLHTTTNFLLLSLAVSDFFVGFLLIAQIMLTDGCWYLGDLMCVLYYVLDVIITSASVGNMVLISLDRYVAVCDPLHYPTKVTPKRVRMCISLCWSCCLCYACVLLGDNLKQPGRFNSCSGECVIYLSFIAQVTDFILTIIIPITAIILLYLRVFVVAVFQVQTMRSQTAAITQKQSGRIKKSELKAARTLGIVVVVFLICLTPYYCVMFIGQDTKLSTLSAAFVICIFYCNSCLNPLIYALYYPWFRNSVRHIVTLQVLRSGSADSNML